MEAVVRRLVRKKRKVVKPRAAKSVAAARLEAVRRAMNRSLEQSAEASVQAALDVTAPSPFTRRNPAR